MTENPIPMEEIATSVSITSDNHLMEGEGVTVYSVYPISICVYKVSLHMTLKENKLIYAGFPWAKSESINGLS